MTELGLLRTVGAEGGASDDEVDAARDHARQRLHAAIATEQQQVGMLGRARRALPVRPALLAGAAVALVVVVSAVFALTALRPPAATARLDRLAVVAEGAQQPVPAADGFVYSRSDVTSINQQVARDGSVITFVANQRIERWWDGSGRLRMRTTYGAPTFPSPDDQAAFEAAGLDAVYGEGVVEDGVFEATQLPETARSWSADPEVLREEMLDEVGSGEGAMPTQARLLELGALILQSPGAPAELRAAVLRVLADEEGIAAATATTPAGAPAVAVMVEYEADGITYERRLVFDATTAQLVELQLVALGELPGELPAGTVLRRQVNEPSGRVASLDSPPTTG